MTDIKFQNLPTAGSPLRKLGKRLAELLDEDQWAECEQLLLAVELDREDTKELIEQCRSAHIRSMSWLDTNCAAYFDAKEAIAAIDKWKEQRG